MMGHRQRRWASISGHSMWSPMFFAACQVGLAFVIVVPMLAAILGFIAAP